MASLRKAINEHCKSCIYDSKSGLGGWRQQVTECPCTSCSLYKVRPRIQPNQADFRQQTQQEVKA